MTPDTLHSFEAEDAPTVSDMAATTRTGVPEGATEWFAARADVAAYLLRSASSNQGSGFGLVCERALGSILSLTDEQRATLLELLGTMSPVAAFTALRGAARVRELAEADRH
jgi:hypothetical protein